MLRIAATNAVNMNFGQGLKTAIFYYYTGKLNQFFQCY